ncbi:hypothetical protein Y032_0002g699 [Ancylostoma ceylanicum]|uniref:Uncharacterized protein n=1 Tax=Ancylostoma ceylanicum TaxID=53326 RepID=A0A016W2P5_9BILA|nr:hypothetical protein Y032_0002g699 [Ancylostoma ceylanicum]
MQNSAGSLLGLLDGDHGGRRVVNPEHGIAETAEQNLRLTFVLQRSGTSDRDGLQSAALTTEPSGLLFMRVFVG